MFPAPKLWRIVIPLLAGVTAITFSVAQTQESPEVARKVVTRVTPQFPYLARTMHISGSVHLEVLVAPNGSVKASEVKGGHPVLAQAAQAAVMQWKYTAATHESHETVEVKFNPE
jgi:TonB family protein